MEENNNTNLHGHQSNIIGRIVNDEPVEENTEETKTVIGDHGLPINVKISAKKQTD